MTTLRTVQIVITSIETGDEYYAKSYPDIDYDDNGQMELYRVPVYKILLKGTNADGTEVKKEWKALRFMPFWNDPKNPSKEYKTRKWVNSGLLYEKRKPAPAYIPDYEVHNRYSPFGGAIQIRGNFLIHAGPATLADYGWGAAGCVEIIGNFDDFRKDIIRMSGSSETDVHKGIAALVKAGKLLVQVDLAAAPELKSRLTWEEPY